MVPEVGDRCSRQKMVTGREASNRETLEPWPHSFPGRHRTMAQVRAGTSTENMPGRRQNLMATGGQRLIG